MADVRRVADEWADAFNAHDERRIRELNAQDITFEAPGDARLEGEAAATEYAMAWLRAFPDAQLAVDNQLVAGDWAVQQFHFRGTHKETLTGPGGDIPATNRRLDGRGVQLLRVAGDKVAEVHLYFDQVQVMTQLGVMPEPAAH